eukprot:408167-Prymnesium_polylepis.2
MSVRVGPSQRVRPAVDGATATVCGEEHGRPVDCVAEGGATAARRGTNEGRTVGAWERCAYGWMRWQRANARVRVGSRSPIGWVARRLRCARESGWPKPST